MGPTKQSVHTSDGPWGCFFNLFFQPSAQGEWFGTTSQCVKGGGARKISFFAKTFALGWSIWWCWLVFDFPDINFHLFWYPKWPKMAHLWPEMPCLAIGGRGGPKWLAQVEQMVVHIGTHAGGLLWTQNASEKCTQRCRNGPKMAHL